MRWSDLTEVQQLAKLLHAIATTKAGAEQDSAYADLDQWLYENIDRCKAIVTPEDPPAWMYPGAPAEPCENLVDPRCEPYCREHAEQQE